MTTEKLLTTEELIRDFNKYYKLYKEWKQRAQLAEKKLKQIKNKCEYDIVQQGYATDTIDGILTFIIGENNEM